MLDTFYTEVSRATVAFKALQDVKKDVRLIETLMVNATDSVQTMIKDKIKALQKKYSALEQEFMEPEETKGYTNPTNLGKHIGATGSYLNSSIGYPGQNALDMLAFTRKEVSRQVEAVNTFLLSDWEPFKASMKDIEWPLFRTIEMPK